MFLTDLRAKRASDQMQIPIFAYPFPEDGHLSERHKRVSIFSLSKVNEKASQTCDEVGEVEYLLIFDILFCLKLALARRRVQSNEKRHYHVFTVVWGMPYQHRLKI